MPRLNSAKIYWKEHRKDRDQYAQTPTQLLVQLRETYGEFDFDPCPPSPTFDGLTCEWGSNNYVNPPFKDLKKWLVKTIEEWKKGKQVVFLMPIRIHTHYFLDLVQPLLDSHQVQIFVLRGGLVFQGYKTKTPFGLMYLVFPGGSSNSPNPTDEEEIKRGDRSPAPDQEERGGGTGL